jgi:hypothetical protein
MGALAKTKIRLEVGPGSPTSGPHLSSRATLMLHCEMNAETLENKLDGSMPKDCVETFQTSREQCHAEGKMCS